MVTAPNNLRDLGATLRQSIRDLADLYRPMAGSPTIEAWQGWPPGRWQSVWEGMEAVRRLDMAGRGLGAHGCPFGKVGCLVDSPMTCDHCARQAAQGRLA